MRSTILLRNRYCFGFVLVAATILSAEVEACPVGGCVGESGNEVQICSSTCTTNGYTIGVYHDEGGDLPPECSGSTTGQYIIVEGTTKQLNLSTAHYPGGLSQTQAQQEISAQLVNPPGNGVYCEANGNQLSLPFWTVTLSNTQGVLACAPARESNLDCGDGSASDMASKFNAHHAGYQLPACSDDNCVAQDAVDGMDSGAPDDGLVQVGFGGGSVEPGGAFHKVTDQSGKVVVIRVGGGWVTPQGVFHKVTYSQGKVMRSRIAVLPGTAMVYQGKAEPFGNGSMANPVGTRKVGPVVRVPLDD